MGNSDAKKTAAATRRSAGNGGQAFKKILVPVDFSKTSIEALQHARDFAQRFGSALVLLHVVEKAPFIAGLETNPMVLSDKEVAQRAKSELDLLAQREFADETSVQTLVRTGKPFNEINQAAAELKADLIIISTHGYTGLKHTLLGSTAERVIRHAPCAVLVVRKT